MPCKVAILSYAEVQVYLVLSSSGMLPGKLRLSRVGASSTAHATAVQFQIESKHVPHSAERGGRRCRPQFFVGLISCCLCRRRS